MTRLTTIFSTGDAGAARGALDAAAELNLKIGGHTAVVDPPPPYAEHLRRTLAPRMAARLNVQDSDGTLIVSFATSLREGSPAAYADEAVADQRKASLHIVLPDGGRSAIPEDVRKGVLAWVAEEKIATLHVTGPREAEEPGIQRAVHDALVWIFEDEVLPRATFAGVDRTVAPESLHLPEAEICSHGDWSHRGPCASPETRKPATPPEQAQALLEAPDVIRASVDVACTDCVRLCFDGVRSKSGGLNRDGVVHASPLDGSDVPLCETAGVVPARIVEHHED